MTTTSTHPTELYVHVTDAPGSHVDVDGRSVGFDSWNGLMIRLDLLAGHHVVLLSYLPASFQWGIVFAGFAVLGLVAWVFSRCGEPTAAGSPFGRRGVDLRLRRTHLPPKAVG